MPLPCTWSSPPGRSFSLAIASTTLSEMTVVSCQSGFSRVVETTYFGSELSRLATGSFGSVWCGQYDAKISYVRRPSRNASALPNHSVTKRPMSWSAYGTSQPPCVKSPLGSSSGPPGLCITPSNDRKVVSVRSIVSSFCDSALVRTGRLQCVTDKFCCQDWKSIRLLRLVYTASEGQFSNAATRRGATAGAQARGVDLHDAGRRHQLAREVEIGELGKQPFGGLPHRHRSAHPSRFRLRERRRGMLDKVLGHELVAQRRVLAVEDLLDVPPDKLLVCLGHRSPSRGYRGPVSREPGVARADAAPRR